MLFGSNLLEECNELPLNRIICLPISAQELYRRAVDLKPDAAHKFSYFIIDTRHQKLFNAGSIPGSYNLNAETVIKCEKLTSNSWFNYFLKDCGRSREVWLCDENTHEVQGGQLPQRPYLLLGLRKGGWGPIHGDGHLKVSAPELRAYFLRERRLCRFSFAMTFVNNFLCLFIIFSALHSILYEIGNLQKLSNHFNKAECIECKRMPQKVESRKGTVST